MHTELLDMIIGLKDETINAWHHTRMILAAFTGVDPRTLVELPGDFENVEKSTPKSAYDLALKYGMREKWNLDSMKIN